MILRFILFYFVSDCNVGGFSHDFTAKEGNVFTKIDEVSKELLQYGVTSFCPTVVTSSSSAYKEVGTVKLVCPP